METENIDKIVDALDRIVYVLWAMVGLILGTIVGASMGLILG